LYFKLMSFSMLGVLLLISHICIVCGSAERSWDYEILSIYAHSESEDKINISFKFDRISFSESAISGTIVFGFDLTDDSQEKIAVLLSHSRSGRDNDYRLTPYQIPQLKLTTFMDNYYNDFGYKNLRFCTNMPKTGVRPIRRNTFIFHQCVPTGDGFPYFLPLGYYKFEVVFTEEFFVNINLTVKVTPKSY
ncbi:hypothetical protein KR044_002345, partial [Drosophila immigrans]